MSEINEEVAEILASQQDHAEDQKVKDLKVYQTTYKINIKNLNCKRLLCNTVNNIVNPYVVFKVQGSTMSATTSVQEKTKNPTFKDITLQLNGYCIGSDLLKIIVYNCESENLQPNTETDKCIGYTQIPVCDLPLGDIITQRVFKLFKSRNGQPLKDKRSREGSAGTVNFDFHIADMGSIAWQRKSWGATYYRAWVHIIGAEGVPKTGGNLSNPYLVSKIKPASNVQVQKTSTCIESANPVWNELHCYMADDYKHQIINFNLQTEVDGKPVILAKTSFQLSLAKVNEITVHNLGMTPTVKSDEKGCLLRLRCQILEKNIIPFDGSVAFKHDLFNCDVTVIEGKEITANEGDKPLAIVSIDKNHKLTSEATSSSDPQWNQKITFKRVLQRQYLDIKVQDNFHRLGNVRIHLTRIPLNQETDNWYTLAEAATGQVHLRIRLTRCEDENEIIDDDPEHHCHFDWEHEELNSDYSTDFTGYSECSKSLSINISSSSEKFHFEPRHAVDIYDDKPIRSQWVSGTLISGKNIHQFPNATNFYAKVSLWGKSSEKKHFIVKSAETDNYADPTFNTEFNFERVKKGDTIRVTIFENIDGKEEPAGWGVALCKALQEEQTVELNLDVPAKIIKLRQLKKFEGIKNLGSVQLSLKTKVTFK